MEYLIKSKGLTSLVSALVLCINGACAASSRNYKPTAIDCIEEFPLIDRDAYIEYEINLPGEFRQIAVKINSNTILVYDDNVSGNYSSNEPGIAVTVEDETEFDGRTSGFQSYVREQYIDLDKDGNSDEVMIKNKCGSQLFTESNDTRYFQKRFEMYKNIIAKIAKMAL